MASRSSSQSLTHRSTSGRDSRASQGSLGGIPIEQSSQAQEEKYIALTKKVGGALLEVVLVAANLDIDYFFWYV